MLRAYTELHQAGHAHCIGCYDGEQLVGGIYGVYVAGVFSAESMFHAATDASKICLLRLIEVLRSLRLTWMDIQTVTTASEPFGAHEISRDEFLKRLATARNAAIWTRWPVNRSWPHDDSKYPRKQAPNP